VWAHAVVFGEAVVLAVAVVPAEGGGPSGGAHPAKVDSAMAAIAAGPILKSIRAMFATPASEFRFDPVQNRPSSYPPAAQNATELAHWRRSL